MIAYLGMYDRPELEKDNDLFWSAIRESLGEGPQELDRQIDPWQAWQSPDLLLAQTCGCPFRTRLYGEVNLIGTLDYGLEGCPPGHYRSVFVARKGDGTARLRDFDRKCFAYNEGLSQSGWAAPLIHMQDRDILPGSLLESGGHRRSAQAVAEGKADFAALDALSWALMQEYDTFAQELCEVEWTSPTPGLPFITSIKTDPAPLYKAIEQAISDLPSENRQRLHLKGLVLISPSDYLAVPTPPGPVLTEMKIKARR